MVTLSTGRWNVLPVAVAKLWMRVPKAADSAALVPWASSTRLLP